MIALKLVKTYSTKIKEIQHSTGQFLYCLDTTECYFDHQDGVRYNDLNDNVVIRNVKSDFDENTFKFFNKVYITLSDNKFYKYNFDKLEYELIYTDTEFLEIIEGSVGLVPATLKDGGQEVAPVTLASNVYYSQDGVTDLNELLSSDLYITTTKVKYIEATIDNQRVFKIPFPVAKYSLYRDHMHVVAPNSRILTPEDYKINNGYLVINSDKDGIAINEKIYFMFYYTRTTNNAESKAISTDNLIDGCITTDKLSPYIEIPAEYIYQNETLQFVTQEQKQLIEDFRNFTIDSIDADIVTENADRKFVTEVMYNLLDALLNDEDDDSTDDTTASSIKYVHPATHPASMIILDKVNKDMEQYVNELEEDVLPAKVNKFDGTIEVSADKVFVPGNYTVLLSGLDGLPVEGVGNLKVETSDGEEFTGLDNTWVIQEFIYNDKSNTAQPNLRIFTRICNNKTKTWGKWNELLSKDNNSSELETDAKDIIGAINEVFQYANDIKSKWQSIIGYPLDNYDSVDNLYAKTNNIKKRLADILKSNGISCEYTQPLQELVNLTPNIGDNNRVRTGLIRSSTELITFTEKDGSTFNEYYIEVETLDIPIGIVNVYSPDGTLHCSIKKDESGIYSIGSHNVDFKESSEGAYIGSGFRVPVEEPDTNYRYFATPISS